MKRRAFNTTSVGASHIKKNKICQDYSASFEGDGFTYIIVSDGHGGDDYIRSDKGAEFAVKASIECVVDFARSVKIEQLRTNETNLFAQLAKSVISSWNDKVWNHYSQVPLSEAELNELSNKAKQKYIVKQRIESLYGATLLAVVVTDEYWFGLHIGDGKCIVKNYDLSFSQPIPWDDKCFLNATTSICDSNALSSFRHYYSETVPPAIFIGSDGIDDCFANDAQLNNLYDAIIASFGQNDFDGALTELIDYIPRLSSKGSGDDMSMAGILDIDNIQLYINREFDEKESEEKIDDSCEVETQVSADTMSESIVGTTETHSSDNEELVCTEEVKTVPSERIIENTEIAPEPEQDALAESIPVSVVENEENELQSAHAPLEQSSPIQSDVTTVNYGYVSKSILRPIPSDSDE